MNTKELKEYRELWSSKTLGEVRGHYLEVERLFISTQDDVQKLAQQLVDLEFDNIYYVDKSKNLMNDLNFNKSYLRDYEHDMKILKPILDKKEIEGIDQTKYENYVKTNGNIKVLIQRVMEMKKRFWDNGHKSTFQIRDKNQESGFKTVTRVYDEMETKGIFDNLIIETVVALEDNIGDITKVEYIRSNGNFGLDGKFTGVKGTVVINTILCGGYNIQCLHYRMLVTKLRDF